MAGLMSRCLLGALLIIPTVAVAQAPVPATLKEAKTVYLTNIGAEPRALDELARHVINWKRLELVDAKEKADVTANLEYSETSRGVYVIGPLIRARSESWWSLTLRDAKSEAVLYSDSETIGWSRYGGLKNLVERWRKRVEEPNR